MMRWEADAAHILSWMRDSIVAGVLVDINVVDVAPAPIFARLERLNDWVFRVSEMGARVLVL